MNFLADDNKGDMLKAFMNLSLGEAIGFTDKRVKNLFPNFPGTAGASILLSVHKGDDGSGYNYNLFPSYAVFKQTYVDPESPMALDRKEMIEYFSNEKSAVNQELFDYLSDNDIFPQILGYDNGPLETPAIDHDKTFARLYDQKNYNPNVIAYDLPTSKISEALNIQESFQLFTP